MVDIDTFLLELYVMVDDFDKAHLPPDRTVGRHTALSRSEVITLGLFSQWARFRSERDFYRWAQDHLRAAFPSLPRREQFNRHLRAEINAVIAVSHHLARQLLTPDDVYEALDGFGMATRHRSRRGAGWLAGEADIGYCSRLGWYEGLHVLTTVTRRGVITGFGVAPASTKDQPWAETFLAARACQHPQVPEVGQAVSGDYVTDTGFEGVERHAVWEQAFGVRIHCAPQAKSKRRWSKAWRRWLASIRQIVETAHHSLLNPLRLDRERPHTLSGVRARLAAKVGLHNFCLWLNRKLNRPWLALADLITW
jgi:hypothetical protein